MEWFVYLKIVVSHICNDFVIKVLGITTVISFSSMLSGLFYDSLNTKAMVAVFFLVLIDMIFGIVASYMSGMEIRSRSIIKTPMKLAIYFLLISSGRLTEVSGASFLPLDESIVLLLAFTEMISILENTANMGYKIPKKIVNRLKEIRNDPFDMFIKKK